MAKVTGTNEIAAALARKGRDVGTKGKVAAVVGYTQSYAIYVHENLESHHPVGEAKFLEKPFRRLHKDLMRQIKDDMKKGLTLQQALLRAGLRLQRDSQLLVPVDTGALKNSAFTKLEE